MLETIVYSMYNLYIEHGELATMRFNGEKIGF